MPGVGLFILAHWRAAGALLIVLALAGYIETLRLERDHAQHQEAKAKAELALFQAEVKALGDKAKAEVLAKEAEDKKRKEDADAENAAALATLADSVGRLRNERDRARRSILPQTGTTAGGADLACFDRPAVERAYGELVTKLRGLADEGAAAVIDLDTAKRWAQKR